MDGRTDGRTDKRTDGRTDGRMDEQLHAAGLMLAAAAVRASFIVLSMSQLYAFCGQCVVAYRNVHLSSSLDLSEIRMCSRQIPQGSPGLATSPEHILVGIQAATMVEVSVNQALQ